MPPPFGIFGTIAADLNAILTGQWRPGMPAPGSAPAPDTNAGPGGAFPLAAGPPAGSGDWQLVATSDQGGNGALDFTQATAYLLELMYDGPVPSQAIAEVISGIEQHYPDLQVSADTAGSILNVRLQVVPGGARRGGLSVKEIIALIGALISGLAAIVAAMQSTILNLIGWRLYRSGVVEQLAGAAAGLAQAGAAAAQGLQAQGGLGGGVLLLGGLLVALYLVSGRR